MKLNDLRAVMSADGVNIFLEHGKGIPFRRVEDSESNEYLLNAEDKDVEVSMWDKYGEFEIEQIYNNSWSDINIDLNIN